MAKYGEIENDHKVVMAAGSVAGTNVSAGLDCLNVEQVALLAVTGDIVATGTINIEVQHSDDDGSSDAYATLTGAVIPEQSTGDSLLSFYGKIRTNVPGVKRWLRISGVAAVAAADWGATLVGYNIGGQRPITVNALPTATFSV